LTADVVVTGASGILGDALLSSGLLPDVVGVTHRAPSPHPSVTVDLRDPAAVAVALGELQPRVVVHTVALTDVDVCERDPGTAFAVAAGTTHHIATWIAENAPGTLLVYISSDQVYAGEGPHREEGTQPLNVYGQSKRAGELAAEQAPRRLVLRTNFFGRSGTRPSYTDWIGATVRAGKEIRVDPESAFSALHLVDLARAIAASIDRGLEGVLNLGAHDSMRKIEFVRAVAGFAAPGGEARVEPLVPSADRAPRPLDLRLDVSRMEKALGETLPTMRDGLERVRAELAAEAS
jgi:dTDP-4-dehydrorhamnose reductase